LEGNDGNETGNHIHMWVSNVSVCQSVSHWLLGS